MRRMSLMLRPLLLRLLAPALSPVAGLLKPLAGIDFDVPICMDLVLRRGLSRCPLRHLYHRTPARAPASRRHLARMPVLVPAHALIELGLDARLGRARLAVRVLPCLAADALLAFLGALDEVAAAEGRGLCGRVGGRAACVGVLMSPGHGREAVARKGEGG